MSSAYRCDACYEFFVEDQFISSIIGRAPSSFYEFEVHIERIARLSQGGEVREENKESDLCPACISKILLDYLKTNNYVTTLPA